jgi:AcrR family transcriptional regulator
VARTSSSAPTTLSKEEIVTAALDLVAEGGVDQLSMRQLSARLGVSLGATYRHVATKDDLLALCARELFLRTVKARGANEDPVDWTRDQMIALYDAICAHPGMATYIVFRIDVTAHETVDAVREALLAAGLPPEIESTVRMVLTFFLIGVLLSAPGVLGASGVPDPRPVIEAGLDHILRSSLPRKRRGRFTGGRAGTRHLPG